MLYMIYIMASQNYAVSENVNRAIHFPVNDSLRKGVSFEFLYGYNYNHARFDNTVLGYGVSELITDVIYAT
jgi:hypothetical protein